MSIPAYCNNAVPSTSLRFLLLVMHVPISPYMLQRRCAKHQDDVLVMHLLHRSRYTIPV